ncbi:MAG: SOS response-associated peptidase [bacterium]
MCGRYTLIKPADTLAALFGMEGSLGLSPRYNIAPTQFVPAVRALRPGEPELALLRWGLIPSWAKDPAIGARTINARGETAAQKPSFRAAFRRRRCLIPADGFYEWVKEGGRKQPYYIQLRGEAPFAFAGLWESWTGAEGETLETCTIITCEANEGLRPLHPRMPVILPRENYDLWLDPAAQDPAALQPLLRPYPAGETVFRPVSAQVNSPKNDGPECIAGAR